MSRESWAEEMLLGSLMALLVLIALMVYSDIQIMAGSITVLIALIVFSQIEGGEK